jgi:two-component system response regulator
MTENEVIEILLVEDNPHDAELTVRAFRKKHLANRLVVVTDGVEALDFVLGRGTYEHRNVSNQPKVILLDIKLPKVNGLEVLRELKSRPETRSIPVVMVTSSREDPDIQTAYQFGANSYVVKPVNFDAFQEAVTSIGLYWLLVNQPNK